MRGLPARVALAECTYCTLGTWPVYDLQLTEGDSTGLSKATISHACAQVSNNSAPILPEFVNCSACVDALPTNQELVAIAGS
ncbi:hypothetical protein DPMN_172738 [Dreissena polymorpha]|uniref:Uncharacterized protein n=1 Tax=Dreissena polymorpha TaxID=45954 RepID=A0A9D4E1E8_DREPO|nr:hypothetical protein DPMN_172738 [Dreissena polymorpha]